MKFNDVRHNYYNNSRVLNLFIFDYQNFENYHLIVERTNLIEFRMKLLFATIFKQSNDDDNLIMRLFQCLCLSCAFRTEPEYVFDVHMINVFKKKKNKKILCCNFSSIIIIIINVDLLQILVFFCGFMCWYWLQY